MRLQPYPKTLIGTVGARLSDYFARLELEDYCVLGYMGLGADNHRAEISMKLSTHISPAFALYAALAILAVAPPVVADEYSHE